MSRQISLFLLGLVLALSLVASLAHGQLDFGRIFVHRERNQVPVEPMDSGYRYRADSETGRSGRAFDRGYGYRDPFENAKRAIRSTARPRAKPRKRVEIEGAI